MTTTSVRDRGRSLAAVVALVCVVAGVTVAVSAAALGHESTTVWTASVPVWVGVVGFVVAGAAAEMLHVPLLHGDEAEDLTFLEIVLVAGMLVLPGSWALVAPLVGVAASQVLLRRPAQKAAFNVANYAIGYSVALVAYLLLRDGADEFSLRGVLSLTVAVLIFVAINSALLAEVLNAAAGIPRRTVLRDIWGLSGLMAVGSMSVAAVAVAVARTDPWLLPFTLTPAFALLFAYRSASRQQAERARNVWLVTLAGLLNEELTLDELAHRAGETVRRAFAADHALLVVGDDAASLVPVLDADGPVDLPAHLLPAGWSAGVAVAIDLAEPAALLVGAGTAARGRWSLQPQDAPVLTTVAASLGSALRALEHRRALVEETTKLQAVVDHTSDGIAVLSGDGDVEMWSVALARITGVSATEAMVRDDDEPGVLTSLRSIVRATGGRQESQQVTVVRPDGEERDLSVTVVHARTGARAERRAILTVHDNTSQARADRLKSDFVATISHELRTPITPIKGYAQLLLARGGDMSEEKRTKALTLIAERADHLGRLVEDLLMASRANGTHAESSRLAAEPTPHDLRDVVEEASSNFLSLGTRLTLELPDSPVPVYCDVIRSVQIVSNLISNATKYSPDDAGIVVRVLPTEFGDVFGRVEVVDHGQGISSDDLERVFERFYRVEDSLTMRTSGSGLGLYIARELASAMGGTLTVRSKPGTGSTFSLALPRIRSTENPVPSQPQHARTA